MSTRSLTIFNNSDNKEIAVMYRHMDGYLEGHGKDLAEFIQNLYVTNDISMNENRKTAKGMECLAAQIIANFKDGPGGIYLYKAKTRNCWEEYIYSLTQGEDGLVYMTVSKVSGFDKNRKQRKIFKGTGTEFLEHIEILREREET